VTTFETILVALGAMGMFAMGYASGAHFTWRNVRRMMVETVAFKTAAQARAKGKKG
jgi:hypothetical protein